MSRDDRALRSVIKRAQKGDEQAFEALMRTVETPMYRLALSMTRQREDAEDATQEALVKLWRTLPDYRFECSILPYALQIVRNTVLDLLRRKRARGETVSLTVESEDGETVEMDVVDPDESTDPARAYASEERIREVRRALDALPIELREILTLRAIEGMSYGQIGEVLCLEEGTVKSRLSRARKKLEEILKSRNFFD